MHDSELTVSLLIPIRIFRHLFSLVALSLIITYGSCSHAQPNTQKSPADTKQPTPEQAELKPFIATYMVTSMGLEGINITNSLSLNNTHDRLQRFEYHFKSYAMSVGLLAFQKDETRDEQSQGFIVKNFIKPEKYNFLQTLDNEIQRDVNITFDWETKTAVNAHKQQNSRWKMSIPDKTMDKLSYQLALMLKLANNPKNQFTFSIADGGRVKDYQFKLLGEERVYTSLGSYKSIKIEHLRYQKNKKITLWCAPELNYLPVKIVQEETGKPDIQSTLISYQEGLSAQ
mgnify:CR=1 FL=1